MPNRDHDDTPYNRNEGRFEPPRQRGYRYNPSRDDYDYRGGSRFEEQRGRYAQEPEGWQEPRSQGYSSGSYWSEDEYGEAGRPLASGTRSYGGPSYSAPGITAPQGNFGRMYGGTQDWNREYTRDWDRDYRGDARYGRESRFGAEDRRGRLEPFEARREQGDARDWGEQLRHAGHQVLGRVKRAFRGPKGYKRSDERIREDVNDRLALQTEFDPSEIEVRIENGEVTLTGSVRSRHEKFRAEEIADEVSGVTEVHNQLRVGFAQAQSQTTAASGSSASTNSTMNPRNGRA